MEYHKVKSVAKTVLPQGSNLTQTILSTMEVISTLVGGTLGPGGRPVLIERQEHNLPPVVTKDGVTVFRSLGFQNSAAQCIMESARDSAARTASEAGDGTTTATILSEAIIRRTLKYSEGNPKVSPQRIVRRLETVFRDEIEPLVKDLSRPANMATEEGRRLLRKVATVSANGDTELADAVMECFRVVGDDGNVTITESNGKSHYEVEQIDGYPIPMGYEDSCTKFYPKFVNDVANQRVLLENPNFVLYHGRFQDPQSLFLLLSKLGNAFDQGQIGPNVVLVGTGFSENVLGYLAMMFPEAGALNVFPLLAPVSPVPNAQFEFLQDLAAVTGAVIADQLNTPLETVDLSFLGKAKTFEATRFRSNVIGLPEDETIEEGLVLRVDQLKANMNRSESKLETTLLEERIGKLTGGIARLKVIGASNGEMKEKRDRAEDAVCAVRGAIKSGCLPGGGWALLRIAKRFEDSEDPVLTEILVPALWEPFNRLLENLGIDKKRNADEYKAIVDPILENLLPVRKVSSVFDEDAEIRHSDFIRVKPVVYDCLAGKHVDPYEGGILDSTPAVLEAIRNSLSIASLLAILGGIVVFGRDAELERSEASHIADFIRNSTINEANERD
jgi:chaperonin GroEL